MLRNLFFLVIGLFSIVLINSCQKIDTSIDVETLSSNTSHDLNSICALNDSVLVAVGGSRYNLGVSCVSNDAGNTWHSDSIGPKTIYDVYYSTGNLTVPCQRLEYEKVE